MLSQASESVKRLNQDLTKAIPCSHETQTSLRLQSPKPEQIICHEPLGSSQGKTEGSPGIAVRIRSFRSRLLDIDNLCAKSIVDGLRYAGLIPDDTPQDISLTVSQEKCQAKEERTEIEITYP